ncbi:beta-galactosidase [Pseudoduganella lurida]|uniref:Beta-galactosidase n=1 Tax=Pseudoduganella lurida TaxID=1036180 RepID=A0A562RAG6_9BURK|nr:glycoside hydrolase family 2 TIM barrel-domain containing protein [Pseudoduganella lurida]TWI65390.1 beta-galactosidase [Pseudoduganella lurida]
MTHSPRRLLQLLPLALAIALACGPAAAERRSLSQDWLFGAGELAGAEQPGFDDSGWRRVVVPHDFGIMDRPDGTPPFDAKAVGGQDAGYLPGGIGWYRRHMKLDAADAARVLRLQFEAVYMDADIWLNGTHVARHRYGYTAFGVDLTGKVKAGDNVIAVRVNHVDPSSRWYAGSGLIRPVTLEVLDPVHIAPDSVFVSTRSATADRGEVEARATVSNRAARPVRVEVTSQVVGADGATVATARQAMTVAARGSADIAQGLAVAQPKLWSPDAPNLYTLVQEVRVDGVVKDVRRTRFGIRTLTVDAQNGLRVNGRRYDLRGGNIHHDNYMLGAAGAPDADARKVALMKAAGYNAIRSAHNPASQATLDAADELGMLVIDEAFDMWRKEKRAADYARFFDANWQQDIDSLVVSGRNHPSVVMWSVGNEIPEQGSKEGAAIARQLKERIRRLDTTRPVTQGVNMDGPDNAVQFAELDVAGYNYRVHLFEKEHGTHPQRVMYTSESTSKDAFRYWDPVGRMPWVIGDFVWTAVDYIGETGIGWMGYTKDWKQLGPYPWNLAYSGEIDTTGRKRPAAYYRQVLWGTGIDPVAAFVEQPAGTADLPDRELFAEHPELDWSLHDLHPSWTWTGQEGRPLKVVVYSEFPEVELFLDGRSLGRRSVGRATEYKADYSVTYAPGRLLAVGYRDGKAAGQWELRTAGAPAAVQVQVDRATVRANGEDLAYVTVELVDANGTPVYARADDRRFTVTVRGAGTLAGAGNGNPMDASSLQSGVRTTFHGRLVAVVRAGLQAGPIDVTLATDGLPVGRVRVDAVSSSTR